MIETLIALGGSLASMGINALKDYLAKKKKEKEALITLVKLNRQVEHMEKRWDALEKKLRNKLPTSGDANTPDIVLPEWMDQQIERLEKIREEKTEKEREEESRDLPTSTFHF